MFKDYYKILEISPDADSATVKAAYRKQALRWHPDRHPNMDVKSIMQDINEAYAILKDPRKRANSTALSATRAQSALFAAVQPTSTCARRCRRPTS